MYWLFSPLDGAKCVLCQIMWERNQKYTEQLWSWFSQIWLSLTSQQKEYYGCTDLIYLLAFTSVYTYFPCPRFVLNPKHHILGWWMIIDWSRCLYLQTADVWIWHKVIGKGRRCLSLCELCSCKWSAVWVRWTSRGTYWFGYVEKCNRFSINVNRPSVSSCSTQLVLLAVCIQTITVLFFFFFLISLTRCVQPGRLDQRSPPSDREKNTEVNSFLTLDQITFVTVDVHF